MTTVAFFDLDYTLLDTSSGIVYLKEIIKQRRVPLWLIGKLAVGYRLNGLDFGQTNLRLIEHVGRQGHIETVGFFEEWITRKLLSHITTAGQKKIAWHQSQGHRVMIISASIEEIVRPMASHLGLGQDYLCTRLAVEDDQYTGQLDGPLCYGDGKVKWAKAWAAENGLDFPDDIGFFYSDSASDLPLLEIAHYPVAVNPSRKLARIAADRDWPIEKFY